MADIRFVRPPTDNKIRNFTPFPRPEGMLHITSPNKNNQRTPWELFLTSKPKHIISQSSSLHHQMQDDTIKDDSSIASPPETRISSDPQINENDKSTPVRPLRRASSLTHMVNASKPDKEKDISYPKSCTERISVECHVGLETAIQDISTSQAYFHTSSTSLDDSIHMEKVSKCPVIQFYSTFGIPVDSLVDVHEEELEQLPEVKKPTGVFVSPVKQRNHTGQIPVHSGENANTLCQKSAPSSNTSVVVSQETFNSQNDKIKHSGSTVFKRSVSSPLFEETEYISFFGSLRKKENQVPEEAENTEESPENNFSTLWDPRRAWLVTSTLNRTYSAESLIPDRKKKRQMSPTEPHSLTPIQSMTCNDDEGDNNEIDDDDDFNVEVKVKIDGELPNYSKDGKDAGHDRLRMRRGALAQPERMIMSQAVREKVEKDVERRKASMVRRVSQFLNVQFGLNREEDLI